MNKRGARQAGFAYIAAIVILVVLSTLAITVTRLSTTQQTTSAQDASLAFALQTARAGTEWGLYQALQLGACNGAGTTLDFRNANGFSVRVTCSAFNFNEGVVDAGNAPLRKVIYTVEAVACNSNACPNDALAGRPDYVERKRVVTACKLLTTQFAC